MTLSQTWSRILIGRRRQGIISRHKSIFFRCAIDVNDIARSVLHDQLAHREAGIVFPSSSSIGVREVLFLYNGLYGAQSLVLISALGGRTEMARAQRLSDESKIGHEETL